MLEEVKTALRISASNSVFNDEINTLILAARLDLVQAGVSADVVNDTDPDALIKRAIVTYAKANFGYDNPEANRFERAYTMLKQHLSLYGDYKASDPDAP